MVPQVRQEKARTDWKKQEYEHTDVHAYNTTVCVHVYVFYFLFLVRKII